MSPSSILQLAKQGHPPAIAALINQVLQPRGVYVQGGIKDGYLQLLLEADEVPDPDRLVPFLYQGLVKLQPGAITMVKIYGQRASNNHVMWSQELHLPVSEPFIGHDDRVRSGMLEAAARRHSLVQSSAIVHLPYRPLLNRKRRIVRKKAWQRFLSSFAAGALATAVGVPLLVGMIYLLENL